MVETKEFAVGIFDALARRRRQKLGKITKEELRDFWLQISEQSFDARLQIFFDMYHVSSLLFSSPFLKSLTHSYVFVSLSGLIAMAMEESPGRKFKR